jgi:Ni,Fe-hydrogenase III component G
MYLPQLVDSARGDAVAVIGPDERALQGESGRTYRYASLEEARADVEVLRRINGENNQSLARRVSGSE